MSLTETWTFLAGSLNGSKADLENSFAEESL